MGYMQEALTLVFTKFLQCLMDFKCIDIIYLRNDFAGLAILR